MLGGREVPGFVEFREPCFMQKAFSITKYKSCNFISLHVLSQYPQGKRLLGEKKCDSCTFNDKPSRLKPQRLKRDPGFFGLKLLALCVRLTYSGKVMVSNSAYSYILLGPLNLFSYLAEVSTR